MRAYGRVPAFAIWTNGHGWRMQLIWLQPVEIPVRDSEPLDLMQHVEQAYIDHSGARPVKRTATFLQAKTSRG